MANTVPPAKRAFELSSNLNSVGQKNYHRREIPYNSTGYQPAIVDPVHFLHGSSLGKDTARQDRRIPSSRHRKYRSVLRKYGRDENRIPSPSQISEADDRLSATLYTRRSERFEHRNSSQLRMSMSASWVSNYSIRGSERYDNRRDRPKGPSGHQ